MDIKEESCFLDFSSENERDTKDLVNKVKVETVTSSSDMKPELENSTCSQIEEDHLMRFNETIKQSEIETKIDIKEEHWYLEREASYVNDIKDEAHEELYSIKPVSVYKDDVSSYIPDLFSTADLANDLSFTMNMDSPECASDRKYQGDKGVINDRFSKETVVRSETSDGGKINSRASSKRSKLLQQRNSTKQDMNKLNCKSLLGNEYRRSYKCDVSEKCFYSSDLEKNRLVLDSTEANKYDVCDKGLNRLSSMKTSKLIEEGEKTHKCNKSFAPSQHLKKHKLNHEAKKPHKCNICNQAFTKLSHLKVHKLIHKGIKPHKCNICSKAFTQLSDLKTHKLIHEGIRPHKCNICSKAFTQLTNLKTHKLFHEGIKPHQCKICNKAFIHLSHLKRHKFVHEGIKPHKCNICYKGFIQSSNLKTHKLSHQGIKPYKCNICNKEFTELSSLKKHIFSHQGIKPHECNICNKAFTQLSHLKRHKLIHDGIRPHECIICNKAFTQSSSLKRHKFIHKDTMV